jgi:flavin-dependent dehydrogenase
MPLRRFDVAIVGAGPAGSATALSLRAHAPTLSVVLIEATHYQSARIGESLPPPVRPMLEHLGVWEAFDGQQHRAVYGTAAAWGCDALADNDFIYFPANTGWQLDRAAFDSMLAHAAQRAGATLMLDTRVREGKRGGDGWRLTLSTGATVTARFAVDATGAAAAVARRCGARFKEGDRLMGIARLFEESDADPRTLVEAFEHGWWYTAALPGARRIIACMTDADLARSLRLNHAQEWHRSLAATSAVGSTAHACALRAPFIVRAASSRRIEPVAGEDWLAVGDCASRFDPLSSQGIAKALRSGIFAGYATGDLLTRSNDSGLNRYRRLVLDEFRRYERTRSAYYGEEQRWPRSEFWRRRHAAATA